MGAGVVVDGVGGNSERGLKWDSGVTEEFFKKTS